MSKPSLIALCTLSVLLQPIASNPLIPRTTPPYPRTNRFSESSIWNIRLPLNLTLAPNSAKIVANIAQDKRENYQSWAVNTDEYSTPIFVVSNSTPVTKWTYVNCLDLKEYPDLAVKFADSIAAVPTPPDLFPSKGSDGAVTIYQPATDTYWDFWRASKNETTGQWSACWGGKITNYSKSDGIFPNPLGATATGLPMGAFTIRIKELQGGYIDHAIGIATVRVRKNCISWPASRSDGNVEGEDLPCEGQRFRLDPSFNVSSLASPAARTIARAMQDYGLIMHDKAGALVTYAEDPRIEMAANGGVDPYFLLMDPDNVVNDGSEKYVILQDIPVESLQALPIDYGKPNAGSG